MQDTNEIFTGFRSHFKNNFVDSWNGVSYDKLLSYKDEFMHDFTHCSYTSFTVADVFAAVSRIALGKASGYDSISAEAIKHCNPILLPKLQELFTACCKHAFVPNNFCGGRITPVPKKAGKCDIFDDFRPITTVNTLGKIFEYCLLAKLEPCLDFHELQFGLRMVVDVFQLFMFLEL